MGRKRSGRKGGEKSVCWFVEVDPISCAFPSCPRFAPSPLSQAPMEAPGVSPPAPAPAPLLPRCKSAAPARSSGTQSSPSSLTPLTAPAQGRSLAAPAPRAGPGTCQLLSLLPRREHGPVRQPQPLQTSQRRGTEPPASVDSGRWAREQNPGRIRGRWKGLERGNACSSTDAGFAHIRGSQVV